MAQAKLRSATGQEDDLSPIPGGGLGPAMPEVNRQWDGEGPFNQESEGGGILSQHDTSSAQNPEEARSGETPREGATLKRPSAPTSMAGSTFTAGASQGAPGASMRPIPFAPLGSPDVGQMVNPQGHMYGRQGGLQGGGLGLPLDPTPNEESDPINLLMKLLSGGQ